MGTPRNRIGNTGGLRINAKATPEQVAEVLERREKRGQTMPVIARSTGLPLSTINSIIYGGCGARTLGK